MTEKTSLKRTIKKLERNKKGNNVTSLDSIMT